MFIHEDGKLKMIWGETSISKYGRIYLMPSRVVISNFYMDSSCNKLKSFFLKCRFVVDKFIKNLMWQVKYGRK